MKMNTFKRLVVLGLAFALLCATLGQASVSAQDKVSLKIAAIEFHPEGVAMFDSIVKEFEDANSNIDVEVEYRSVDGHKEALRVSLNTSAAPDLYVMWAGIGLGFFYVSSGGVEPIDSYYEQYGWGDRFLATSLAAAQMDGVYYGAPYAIHAMGLYYSKAAFEDAGIEAEPQTYDELIAANEKLVEAGYTPLSVGGKFGWNTMRLLDSLVEMTCGADLHSSLKALTSNWAEEECVTAAFSELRRWVDEGWLPENFLGIDPGEAKIPVYQGRAAMLYEGDWLVSVLRADEQNLDEYDFFPFPTGTERLSFFTEMFFITKASQHKDEAALFVDYFTSPDVQGRYLGPLTTISPTIGTQVPENWEALNQQWADVMGQYPGVYFPADQEFPNEITSFYFKVQDDVISGVLAAEDAGAALQAEIDRYVAAQ
jgi:raffinose/stachyose/melibiose transport system substrate-binding protein